MVRRVGGQRLALLILVALIAFLFLRDVVVIYLLPPPIERTRVLILDATGSLLSPRCGAELCIVRVSDPVQMLALLRSEAEILVVVGHGCEGRWLTYAIATPESSPLYPFLHPFLALTFSIALCRVGDESEWGVTLQGFEIGPRPLAKIVYIVSCGGNGSEALASLLERKGVEEVVYTQGLVGIEDAREMVGVLMGKLSK